MEKMKFDCHTRRPKNLVDTPILPLLFKKCHLGLQNYKTVILVSRITKMPLWAEIVGPMT